MTKLFKTPTAQLGVNGGSQHPDKRKAGGHGPTLADEIEHLLPPNGWGEYEPAVRRWEALFCQAAPTPTTEGRGVNRVLNPELVEWMMGLPAGLVTGTPGISRPKQLRLLGNGVVPQQAEFAIRQLLNTVAESQCA